MLDTFSKKGLISRKEIDVVLSQNTADGIRFKLKNSQNFIEAKIENLYSTQRNTVLAKQEDCVCLTEHFLAACALLKITNIDVELSESELPFGDGSAAFWIDYLNSLNLDSKCFARETKILKQGFEIKDESDPQKFIKVSPADSFSLTYKMDWDHPALGKQEYTWTENDPALELARARTFSNEAENLALGLSGWVLGYDESGFKQELYYNNEPARHKALDLLGDLMLSGINPTNIKMSVISSKGGHELNSRVAKKIKEIFGV